MTWRIWSPVGSTSSSNASFETSFSSDAASALDEKRRFAWKAAVHQARGGLKGATLLSPNLHRAALAGAGPILVDAWPNSSQLRGTGLAVSGGGPRQTPGQSGRLDLNQRPFGPQPSGPGCRCIPEGPDRPLHPAFWTTSTHRTHRSVPKRYHQPGVNPAPARSSEEEWAAGARRLTKPSGPPRRRAGRGRGQGGAKAGHPLRPGTRAAGGSGR
jgi:hypothetical protein